MARVTRQEEYPMTVAPELFEAWTKLRRKKDPEEIAQKLGKSRPIIDRALKYGHVKDDNVVAGITKFYQERLSQETKDGKELIKKSQEQ